MPLIQGNLKGKYPDHRRMVSQRRFPHLLGSRWTAKHPSWGWRHFQVVNRCHQGQWIFAELVACCDPTVRFWVNAQQLKDRSLWRPGWQPLAEISSFGDLS